MTHPQIPVFLLTGFLGAGKTTLLNKILQHPAFQDTALVINEFGLVSVDHDLVQRGSEQPMVTTTGCICCTVGSDLRSSLDELLLARRNSGLPPFSRVIVETTGLADPAPIINSLIPGGMPAHSLRDHAVARAFRLSGVITVVDVEGIQTALQDHTESLRQLAFADHIVLTRTDVCPPSDWPMRLHDINPAARIHDIHSPDFSPEPLLAPGSYTAFGKGQNIEHWLQAENGNDHSHGGGFHDLNRHGGVRAIPLGWDEPINERDLYQFLIRLAVTPENGLLRIKGLAALKDDPSSPALIHAVQHRLYPFTRLQAWPSGKAENRIILIGTNLNENAIRQEFAIVTKQPKAFSLSDFASFRK